MHTYSIRKCYKKKKKKKRKTNASRFFCRNESFSLSLLNLERATPKEGGLGISPRRRPARTRWPVRVTSHRCGRGAISAIRGDSRVSLFAYPASSPNLRCPGYNIFFSPYRLTKFWSAGQKGKWKKKRKEKPDVGKLHYQSSVNDVVNRENKRRARSTFFAVFFFLLCFLYFFLSLVLSLLYSLYILFNLLLCIVSV